MSTMVADASQRVTARIVRSKSVVDALEGLRGSRTSADPEHMRVIGRAIGKAMRRSGVELKDAVHRLGYQNHSTLCWSIEELRCELVVALAEACDEDVAMRKFVVIARRLDGDYAKRMASFVKDGNT
jgi:hypothetical protein